MKFSLERPVKIVMLGAGGTGGYAAPHIYRLIHTLNRPARFLVADGDIVEEKNLVRQNFIHADLGRNKAAVMAVNIIPLGSHQFPASEPPGNGIFHLQSHHNILWQHTYLISL